MCGERRRLSHTDVPRPALLGSATEERRAQISNLGSAFGERCKVQVRKLPPIAAIKGNYDGIGLEKPVEAKCTVTVQQPKIRRGVLSLQRAPQASRGAQRDRPRL
jgi:hypothetical protein